MNVQSLKIILPASVWDYFIKGNERTARARRHVALSFVYKGFDLVIGLALVSLVLTYLGKERYGIWLVLFSVTSYFTFLNIGLEQGFRNKFAEAIANQDMERAKYYVSTTYAVITLIISVFFIIFLVVNKYINWVNILNTSSDLSQELSLLALIVFGSFSITFVLKIATTFLVALQKPSIINLKNLSDKVLKFVVLLLLLKITKGSLLNLGLLYCITPIITLSIISIFIFSGKYKEFRPSFNFIDFSYTKELMQLGYKFFIISIASVILFTTDNLIITQLFGPAEVTPYQIAHRYFGILLTMFIIYVKPIWSAVTDAYIKENYSWIVKTYQGSIKIWVLSTVILGIMLLLSNLVYTVWLGNEVIISFTLSTAWAIFIWISMFGALITQFINGIGKIKISLYTAIINIFINIPLSIFLASYMNIGSVGVISATTICITISIIIRSIQLNKLLNNTAEGIWAK